MSVSQTDGSMIFTRGVLDMTETNPKKRVLSLDLARGSMLLLIILAHVPLFLYTIEPGVITKVAPANALEKTVNFLMELIVDNRARPLFAVLFGYGLVMIYRKQSERKGENEAKRIIRRRCWYLILFGAILAGIAGGQDILMTYGIAGLILAGSLKKTNDKIMKRIVISVIICLIYLPVLWGGVLTGIGDYGLPTAYTGNETYFGNLAGQLISIPIVPLFTHLFFPIIPSVYMGIWMGNKELLIQPDEHARLLKRLTVWGLVLSAAGAIPLALINDFWFPGLFTAGFIYGLHMMTGLAAGFGYAGVFALAGMAVQHRGKIIGSIAATGKRSLTFFILQECLIVITMSPVAFNLGAHLNITTAVILAAVIWIATLVIANIMEKRQMAGPLEKLMRTLTYSVQK